MIYKDFQNLRLPMLGFGSMRLPLLPGGGDGDVDEAAVAEMVALAMERGANYFDTAYGYHNGNSERVMGRVLSRYPRESWLLASKFPGYDVSNIRPDRVEAIFEEQLEKCGVDYFDFYLFHNVYERNVGPIWTRTTACWSTCSARRRPGASGTWASPPTAPWR